MSAEQARLESYRNDLIDTVRRTGEQAALSFDRDWSDEALETLERLAADGIEFTADHLIELVGEPASPNAIGAVFGKASRAGLIRMVGVSTSRRISRHGGLQRVWGRQADGTDRDVIGPFFPRDCPRAYVRRRRERTPRKSLFGL